MCVIAHFRNMFEFFIIVEWNVCSIIFYEYERFVIESVNLGMQDKLHDDVQISSM